MSNTGSCFLGLVLSGSGILKILVRFTRSSSTTSLISASDTYALPICSPSFLKSPLMENLAITYPALKRVSAPSMDGFLSIMAIFLITRALNGLMCIFSNWTSPSSLFSILSMTLPDRQVCTCGSWIARTAARNKAVTATKVSQNIFNTFFIFPVPLKSSRKVNYLT